MYETYFISIAIQDRIQKLHPTATILFSLYTGIVFALWSSGTFEVYKNNQVCASFWYHNLFFYA